MGLRTWMRGKVGEYVNLDEAPPAPGPEAPRRPASRVPEEVGEGGEEEAFGSEPVEAPPAGAPAPVDLGALYARAKIVAPAHGYTAESVARLLESPRLAAVGEEARRQMVLATLELHGVPLEDIALDAEARLDALAAHEDILASRNAREDEAAERSARELEAEVERTVAAARAQIAANRRSIDERRAVLEAFRRQRRAEVARLHAAAAAVPMADGPPPPSDLPPGGR